MRSISMGLVILSLVLLLSTTKYRGADYEPGTPNTYLFDTGSSSDEGLTAAQLAAKSGWKLVPEDTLNHEFQGDVVLLNDRLTVVLRGKGAEAVVYCQTVAGPKPRAVLLPVAPDRSEGGSIADVQILENSTAAVMVNASIDMGDHGKRSLTYRLTVGQMMMEITPGESEGKLMVATPARYVVVPNFFGDDMVFNFDAALPTENFLLNLVDGGDAMVMCVWQSNRQNAEAMFTGEGLTSNVIQCVKGKKIWVAFLDAPAIWHERSIANDKVQTEVVLDWKPPFAAKWRADRLGDGGFSHSWLFQKPGESDEPAPVGADACPFRFDANRVLMQLEPAGVAALPSKLPPDVKILIYAMDRSRATPLTAFCPIDVLRSTLGVGPCQYILQTEGLDSKANPTPDSVMTFVERQFSRKKEKKAAEEIRGMLKQMTGLMTQTQTRIGEYAKFADDVRATCAAELRDPAAVPAAATFNRIASQIQQAAFAASGTPKLTDRAAQLAGEVIALIGKDGALDECRRLGGELRALGALQDRALANCRMDARWLRQRAVMFAADNPDAAALAKRIQAQVEQLLRK